MINKTYNIERFILYRCGALSVGDQILSVDETVVENTSFTPEEITSLLNANCTKGYTQIQILPAHALLRRKGKSTTTYDFHSNPFFVLLKKLC